MIDINICLICYQQAECIQQCLDSILGQRTAYSFQIVVGDDGSTDGTYEVLTSYATRYPDQVRLLPPTDRASLADSSMPSAIQNYLRTLQACDARFVAVCDGDDYWTDDQKLQKQITFLEENQDYSMCFHPVSVWQNGVVSPDEITAQVAETTTIEDLAVRGNYIHTCSCMCRNYLHTHHIPAEAAQAPLGDYFIYMLVARFGKIKCLPDNMAVYRLHADSYWSKLDINTRRKYTILSCQLLLKTSLFDPEVEGGLKQQISRLSHQIQEAEKVVQSKPKGWFSWVLGRKK